MAMEIRDGYQRTERQVDGTLQDRGEGDRVTAARVGIGEVERLAQRGPGSRERIDRAIVLVGERGDDEGLRTALEGANVHRGAVETRQSALVGVEAPGELPAPIAPANSLYLGRRKNFSGWHEHADISGQATRSEKQRHRHPRQHRLLDDQGGSLRVGLADGVGEHRAIKIAMVHRLGGDGVGGHGGAGDVAVG